MSDPMSEYCPECGIKMDEVYTGTWVCPMCDYDEWLYWGSGDDDDLDDEIESNIEFPDEPTHEGFWMDVDGESAHFLADPNMSKETEDALKGLVRHVRKLLDEGWRPKL